MTKLTDTQLIVLNAAAQRSTLLALPLPPKLKGVAAHKVIHPLIKKGLLEEIDADRRLGEPVWRETGDGHSVTLAITPAGLSALSIEANAAPQAADGGEVAGEATPTPGPTSQARQRPPRRLRRARSETAPNRRPSSTCCGRQTARRSRRSPPPPAGRTIQFAERSQGR